MIYEDSSDFGLSSLEDIGSLPVVSISGERSLYFRSKRSYYVYFCIKVRNLDVNAGRWHCGKYIYRYLNLYVSFGIQYYFDKKDLVLRERVIYIEKLYYEMSKAEKEKFALLNLDDALRVENYVKQVLKRGALFKGYEVRSVKRI